MINIILSTIPFILIAYNYFKYTKNKKLEDIYTDVNIGYRCYSCKEKLEEDRVDYILIKNIEFKEILNKCIKCKRDDKISSLLKFININILIDKLKRKLYRRRSNIINISLFSLLLFFIILSTISILFKVESLKFANNIHQPILIITWLFIIYKNKLSYIKKPS